MVASPTYKMLKDATLRTFQQHARDLKFLRKFNRADMTAILGNDAEVLFRSADDPETLRGPNLSGLWLDEAGQMQREAFDIAIACLREGGEQGWISATFTPKGRSHWTYDVFGKNGENTALFKASTRQNPFNHAGFYETVKHQYSPLRALQELEGEFLDIEGAEWPGEFFGDHIWLPDEHVPGGYRCKVVSLDPSKGKNSKHGDYSSFIELGVCNDGTLEVDAHLQRITTNIIVEQAIDIQRRFQADAFGVETNQFQELLADEIANVSQARGIMLPIYGIDNRIKKEVRIRRLTPYLSRKLLRFKKSPGCELLVQQMRDFPLGEHDDGPDALEMAIRLATRVLNENEPTEDEY
jgi:predicted phage terminase large subunit-like protein